MKFECVTCKKEFETEGSRCQEAARSAASIPWFEPWMASFRCDECLAKPPVAES